MFKQLRGCMEIFGEYVGAPVLSPEEKLSEGGFRTTKRQEGRYIPLSSGTFIVNYEKFQKIFKTAVGFLTTRISKINLDDWVKLWRVLIFVRFTLKEITVFFTTKINEMFTCVYASYAINHDMRSQTGDAIYVVLVVTHCRSNKQKLTHKNLYRGRVGWS